MPIVLVVDDSPHDRRLVGGVLVKDQDLDWVIEYARHGGEALELMHDLVPDVVVIDLMTPEVDGLRLVASIRTEHPHVPAILITGHGSEAQALDALSQGAASFVPKDRIADELLDTVKQVLGVSQPPHKLGKLQGSFLRTEFSLNLANDPALIPILVDLVMQTLAIGDFGDVTERIHLGIALEEALLNALYHGNLEIPPEQMLPARAELSQGKECAFAHERRDQMPFRERKTYVAIRVDENEARFVVRDQGNGFQPPACPDRGAAASVVAGGKRGLVLMRTFLDRVEFNETGNEITLIKDRPKARLARA